MYLLINELRVQNNTHTHIYIYRMLLLDDDKVGSADVPGFTRLLGIPSVGSIICCFQKVLYKYIMFGVLIALVTLILSEDHLTLLKCNQDLIILCRRRSPILKKQDL